MVVTTICQSYMGGFLLLLIFWESAWHLHLPHSPKEPKISPLNFLKVSLSKPMQDVELKWVSLSYRVQ